MSRRESGSGVWRGTKRLELWTKDARLKSVLCTSEDKADQKGDYGGSTRSANEVGF